MRRDFIANVSHELRTPVSIILASAETLESGIIENPNKHVVRFLEAIHRNADRMGRLINDLLDISRIESGRYELELSNVDLRLLIERVLRGVETKLTEHETELHFEILDPLEVQGDPKALDQIFVNLIHNATKYTPKGSTLRVYAASSSRPNRVRICVEDNGPGIPDKYRPRLFERFYRVDKGRSRDAGGTGLGLAIVKHLVQAMNGDVGCDAALPHGSIFWVELPQKSGSAIE
jgi:two-component system phosphate regulon sensor histidine kinase PhoR